MPTSQALAGMFSYAFMVNAFEAGTIVAVVAAAIGWFVVLRRQTFAGHALAVIGFPGAAGATLLGIGVAYGYFGACLAAAVVIAMVPSGRGAGRGQGSAVTGTVQAFALACGFLFVSLYGGFLGGISALLFGSFLGITTGQVAVLLVAGGACLVVLAVLGRPLLFASVDGEVAAARGVPVRALAVVFLLLVGVAVAEASQITGTLLVFALLVAPPAAAQALTMRPAASLALGVALAVGVTWAGLAMAYFLPYPSGFLISTLAFAVYVLARAVAGLRARAAIA